MASNIENNLNSLILSASEIRSLTGWPDPMVEDYLNILRNIIAVAIGVDGISLEIDELKPLSGGGDPNGIIEANYSLAYYRRYQSGNVDVKEHWVSDTYKSTAWEIYASFTEQL